MGCSPQMSQQSAHLLREHGTTLSEGACRMDNRPRGAVDIPVPYETMLYDMPICELAWNQLDPLQAHQRARLRIDL